MNNIKSVESITHQELQAGIYGGLTKGSWHETYKESAWVFLGGFSFELSEGDIICVMSQWGEVEDINLVRDKETNKSRGFAFIKYEDQRSTILAVDNFNGIKLLGRSLRCDHIDEYKLPKDVRTKELELLQQKEEKGPSDVDIDIGPGHAYKHQELADGHDILKGVDLWNTSNGASDEVGVDGDGDGDGSKKRKHHHHEHSKKASKKHKDKDKDRKTKSHRSSEAGDDRKLKSQAHDTASDSLGDAKGGSGIDERTFRAAFLSSSGSSSIGGVAAASWRGNRDPAVNQQSILSSSARLSSSTKGTDSSSSQKPRMPMDASLSGIGGVGRNR